MFLYYFSVSLAIFSNLLYHVAQKLTPANANPALALVVTYLVSAGTCLVLLLTFYPLQTSLKEALGQLNWASFALGISVVGLELGFLLAYRAGWNISLAAIAVNAGVGLLVIPVGLLFFKEHLSWVNVLGILLSVLGLIMINLKR
jgi:uncharacterized membrane protein